MDTHRLRLFFALPCPTDCAARIVDWRNTLASDGTPVAPDNLHVTLAFLGEQSAERVAQLLAMAETIQTPAFSLQLDRLDRWAGGVLHLAPSQPPRPLLDLASRLRTELLTLGIDLEAREYRPHLTLARHCQQPLLGVSPTFAWEAREFCLLVSEADPSGVHYRALASWALRTSG